MSQYVFEIDGNYVNFNGGGNLWRLHKDSNCVSWHWDESGDLFFDVYDQEYVVKAENIGEVVVGGVTLTTAADFETNIKIVFPGLAGGGSSSYLVYAAILNQVGTDNPTVIVLENTIGPIVWTRGALGQYDGTLAGAFTVGKTIMPPFVPNNGIVYIMLGGATADQYNYSTIINDVNSVTVLVGKTDFSGFVDLSTVGTDLFIEIRVYS